MLRDSFLVSTALCRNGGVPFVVSRIQQALIGSSSSLTVALKPHPVRIV